ncbi:YdcF family protein [Alkalihalobacillus sp. MEB130]|uniref:YdcF family protein n=1 Tax=Alkalihalobacillus sp. MEB130 TaxID=2976704 RepID=UPI0028DFF3E5|nr:YdcF family protein [Alkalihalobacillus sp. MEB130]MDT8861175.1 YdcF family protein [Alkalihalobacillus sp. MEB130]
MGKKVLFNLFLVSIVFATCYVGFLHIQILRYSSSHVIEDADYVIILGARVKGEIPSLSLQHRINAALEYLIENKNTLVIASGGQGPGEDITEAEAIKRELLKNGIEESRILLEEQSTSTLENLTFSKDHIPNLSGKGIIVTNRYHLYRAILIAKDYGLDVMGLPAETPKSVLVQSYAREYLAITKYFLQKGFARF